jgi:hypothetical protein
VACASALRLLVSVARWVPMMRAERTHTLVPTRADDPPLYCAHGVARPVVWPRELPRRREWHRWHVAALFADRVN